MRLQQPEFKILQQLRTIPEFKAGRCVVHLMLSGGKDSVALLQVLHKLQTLPSSWSGISFTLVLHHFNHRKRGSASNDDELLCFDLARSTGQPLQVWRWNEELQNKIEQGANFQALARDWRYSSVRQFAQQSSSHLEQHWLIATAHHRRDHAETVILNLTRGCGISGMAGLSPWCADQRILRPFLWLSADDCDHYIQTKNLPHRDDESNNELDYTRNRVRHCVVPELEKINTKAIEHLWQLSLDVSREQKPLISINHFNVDRQTNKASTTIDSIQSEQDLRLFLAENLPPSELNLSRKALFNVYNHLKKCQRFPQEPRQYHFAVSERFTLRLTNKHLEIKVTEAKFSEPHVPLSREL